MFSTTEPWCAAFEVCTILSEPVQSYAMKNTFFQSLCDGFIKIIVDSSNSNVRVVVNGDNKQLLSAGNVIPVVFV